MLDLSVPNNTTETLMEFESLLHPLNGQNYNETCKKIIVISFLAKVDIVI